jgi:hypothetical protein
MSQHHQGVLLDHQVLVAQSLIEAVAVLCIQNIVI